MNFKHTIENPNPRESELCAVLESTLNKLAQAKDYIQFMGGTSEAIADIDTHLNVQPYLQQHGINMPIFKYEGTELPLGYD